MVRHSTRVVSLLLMLVLAMFGSATTPLSAQPAPSAASSTSEQVARDAISQLRSPYCPGLMLEVCPSTPAELLRDSIRGLAAEGRTADQIVEWMLARHGEEWRAVPKRSGIGLWAWILPPLALLIGAGVLIAKLRTMRATGQRTAPEEERGGMTEHEHARVAAALREWEAVGEADA